MSRALVTGGAGFIGSALSRQLTLTFDEVVVLDDLSSGRAENLEGVDVDLHVGSILDESLLHRLTSGVEVVFHLACKGVRHSIHDPRGNHDVNATGSLMVLEAAGRSDVRRVIYTSTSEVYGTAIEAPMAEDHPTYPHTVYGASKLVGEAYARAYYQTYGLETVVIRPFNAYGPRSHHEGDSGEVIPKFLVRAMNGLPPVIFGDGSQTRDFTYVEDTAAGVAAAAYDDDVVGETINLGSGSEVSVEELAAIVLKAVGRADLDPMHTDARPGDVLRLLADSAKAKRLMGWEAKVGLVEGVARLIDWHAEAGTDWAVALSQDRERNWEAVE